MRAYVNIGSNIDRERNIAHAVDLLERSLGPLRLSSVYESPAVGFDGEHFYNVAAGFETSADPHALLTILRGIESQCGRVKSAPRFSSRTLDIDLLLAGDHVIKENGLELPRGEVLTQAHVLGPLAEVAADERHPVLGASIGELWSRFDRSRQPIWVVDYHPRPDADGARQHAM